MADQVMLLVALVALLLGLAIGKAWERYKLRDGGWVDRRKIRESPHYLQALNYLVANQIDHAIDELTKAADLYQNSLEIDILLGNLYREKGQVGRAIHIHQQLLQRPRLGRFEQSAVLLSLGLDYKRGGFVDRAVEAFVEVLRVDPDNTQALFNLEKLHEDQHQWLDARAIRTRLAALAPESQQARHQTILAFLENAIGADALEAGDSATAVRHFHSAIELDPTVVPAHLSLGDVRRRDGDAAGAIEIWERLVAVAPDKAYLVFDRLARATADLGTPERFSALCRRMIAQSPPDWRARLALARHLGDLGGEVHQREALALLLDALAVNPHAVSVHQAAWRMLSALGFRTDLVERYVSVSRDAVFYQDPHICMRCHYRSTELLWQCPHCHEWNSFVEERLTPAKDEAELHARRSGLTALPTPCVGWVSPAESQPARATSADGSRPSAFRPSMPTWWRARSSLPAGRRSSTSSAASARR